MLMRIVHRTVERLAYARRSALLGLLAVIVIPLGSAADARAIDESGSLEAALLIPSSSCADVSKSCCEHLPRFFYEDRPDSVFALLDHWEESCGAAELIRRTRLLATIWTDGLAGWAFAAGTIDDLIDFRWHLALLGSEDDVWPWLWEPLTIQDVPDSALADFEYFAIDLADQLASYAELASIEHLLCRFYAGHETRIFTRLKDPRYAQTPLRRRYDRELHRVSRKAYGEWGLYAGLWSPGSNLSLLGDHPLLGLFFSWRWYRGFVRLPLAIRFGFSDNSYTVRHDGNLLETDRYGGVYTGLEPGLSFPLGPRRRIDLYGSIAYDGIQWETFGDEAEYLHSLCLGLGLEFRQQLGLGKIRFLSLGLRHDWLNHDTNGGTNLDGNAWTFRCAVGSVLGHDPNERLAELEDRGW